MLSDATADYGRGLGFKTARDFRHVGRAGVLGSCPLDVAVGALAFVAADMVEQAWNHLPSGLSHADVNQHYVRLVVHWGDTALAGFDTGELERVDVLGRRIVAAAPASLGSLFAGWRSLPLPTSVEARAAMTTQVLREMRGAAHITAVIAAGLTPLEAILASTNSPPKTGPEFAEAKGFVGPFRDPEEVRERRLRVEDDTSRLMERYYSVLSPDELEEFTDLIVTTRNALDD